MKMKMFSSLLIIMIIASCTVFAGDIIDPGIVTINPNNPNETLVNNANRVLGFIVFIAWAVALGMILIIGMKYMSAGAGARAEVKSTFLPYVIGAVIVASSATIFKFISTLGN